MKNNRAICILCAELLSLSYTSDVWAMSSYITSGTGNPANLPWLVKGNSPQVSQLEMELTVDERPNIARSGYLLKTTCELTNTSPFFSTITLAVPTSYRIGYSAGDTSMGDQQNIEYLLDGQTLPMQTIFSPYSFQVPSELDGNNPDTRMLDFLQNPQEHAPVHLSLDTAYPCYTLDIFFEPEPEKNQSIDYNFSLPFTGENYYLSDEIYANIENDALLFNGTLTDDTPSKRVLLLSLGGAPLEEHTKLHWRLSDYSPDRDPINTDGGGEFTYSITPFAPMTPRELAKKTASAYHLPANEQPDVYAQLLELICRQMDDTFSSGTIGCANPTLQNTYTEAARIVEISFAPGQRRSLTVLQGLDAQWEYLEGNNRLDTFFICALPESIGYGLPAKFTLSSRIKGMEITGLEGLENLAQTEEEYVASVATVRSMLSLSLMNKDYNWLQHGIAMDFFFLLLLLFYFWPVWVVPLLIFLFYRWRKRREYIKDQAAKSLDNLPPEP